MLAGANLKGKLTLLCGPSGVGKTTFMRGSNRSYRIIDIHSRRIRDYELVDLYGRKVTREDIEKQIDEKGEFDSKYGIFLSKNCFQQRINDKNKFFVWYKTGDNRRYGFGIELKDALNRGEDCVEQIVEYDAINVILKAFKGYDVKKILILESLSNIKRRLQKRDSADFKKRFSIALKLLPLYAKNQDLFDEVIKPKMFSDNLGNYHVSNKS